jgi:hypothetical protein
MRNFARVLAFDVAAPAATIAGLLAIGAMLDWPRWWVAVCSMLCLLVVQAVVVNVVGYRRDSVTLGTDDDAPGLRLAAVAVAAAVLVCAVVVGNARWARADRAFDRDTAEVVRIASTVSEATASFTPSDPGAGIDRAAAMMTPEGAERFRAQFTPATADLARREVTATARTVSAGLEALGPDSASVAVVLRGTQSEPGEAPSNAVVALRIGLVRDGGWKVLEVGPINSR